MGVLKTILLTGATGFVGSHLLGALISKHYNVVTLTRPESDLWRVRDLNGYINYTIDSSNFDYGIIFQENKVDAVVHLATDYGRSAPYSCILRANVMMPLQLLEAAIKHGTSLFINTDTFIAKKESSYNYLNRYAQSKILFRDILIDHAKEITAISMKLEHPYGDKDSETKFVTQVIRELLNNKAEIDLTAGTQRRDFIYVNDVVDAFLVILNKNEINNGFQEFEVGTAVTCSIKEFVEKARELSGSKSKLNFGRLPMREGEFKESKADNAPLKKLGWLPRYSLDEGLAATIAFEKARRLIIK